MSLVTSETLHTNADYRCRIVDNKYAHFMVKQCAVVNNYGSKKELYLPRRNIYLEKTEQIEDLNVGDYVTVKLKLENKRTLIESIINFTKVNKVTNVQKAKSSKNKTAVVKEQTYVNRFSALMDSSDDEE